MNHPHGYTLIDVIAACLLVFVLLIVAGMLFTNPAEELAKQRDEVRMDDVRDLMEMMLEMKQEDPTIFWSLLEDLEDGPMMVGTAESCGSDYKVDACGEQMDCLNLLTWSTVQEYLPSLPVDPNEEVFSYERSGYYLSYDDRVLEIGACSPEYQSGVLLMSFVE